MPLPLDVVRCCLSSASASLVEVLVTRGVGRVSMHTGLSIGYGFASKEHNMLTHPSVAKISLRQVLYFRKDPRAVCSTAVKGKGRRLGTSRFG
jgi:hypothetical protein